MTIEEKIEFLKENIEPIHDHIYGNGYRASAYLTDGTYIPCVRFRNPTPKTELAIKRFDEEKRVRVFLKIIQMMAIEILSSFL